MKKYALNFSILIVIMGLFVPMLGLHASPSNPSEPCTFINHEGIPDNPPCDQLGGASSISNASRNNASFISCDDFGAIRDPKLQDVLSYITCILVRSVVPLIFALALVVFIWGVVQYVINTGDEARKEQGRQFMLWGIIALAVMVSVWGLVGILGNTFGLNNSILPSVRP